MKPLKLHFRDKLKQHVLLAISSENNMNVFFNERKGLICTKKFTGLRNITKASTVRKYEECHNVKIMLIISNMSVWAKTTRKTPPKNN